ncbi:biopolymer transporter ExbD [Corallococcus sp. EGB]|uniref:ExbD/TolR family protein n=1 Tax=Corallococcus sp. EGB TaxID=1521117 RepID=UPI001CBD908A|nr:biopolymer transporter ExbD [Corallococcus sp. EGB]
MAGTLGGGGGRRGGTISNINVTPLVDVVLVLLIILMVSSTYIVAQTLKVQLPRASSSDGMAEKPTTVVVQKDGKLLMDEQPAEEAVVRERLTAAVKANPDMNLVVSADKDTPHGAVVHIIDLAKVTGITHFAINVQAD